MGKPQNNPPLNRWDEVIGTIALLGVIVPSMQELCDLALQQAYYDARQHGYGDLQDYAAWLRAQGHDSSLIMAAHAYEEAKYRAEKAGRELGLEMAA